MDVRVHESREDRSPLEVQNLGAWPASLQEFRAASHGDDAIAFDRQGFVKRKPAVNSHHFSTVQDQVRLGGQQRSGGAHQGEQPRAAVNPIRAIGCSIRVRAMAWDGGHSETDSGVQ
jgi:hypothetical protein